MIEGWPSICDSSAESFSLLVVLLVWTDKSFNAEELSRLVGAYVQLFDLPPKGFIDISCWPVHSLALTPHHVQRASDSIRNHKQ